MKTPTTILLAITLATAAATANAYQITAPPEIVAAAKLSGELARDVLDFGPRCRAALIYDLEDKTPCEIIGEIASRMIEPANTVHAWLAKVRADGATTVSNLPDVTDQMNASTAMLETLTRLHSYGAQK